MSGVTLDRPPLPGAIPNGAHVIVAFPKGDAHGYALAFAASTVSAGPQVLVRFGKFDDAPRQWVERDRVKIAPPSPWERWRPRLEKLRRRIVR